MAFGGDVTLGPDAVLGSTLRLRTRPSSCSAVSSRGRPAPQVIGQTDLRRADWARRRAGRSRAASSSARCGASASGAGSSRRCSSWCWPLSPRRSCRNQLRGLQRHLGGKPWASLGWGALIFFIIGPAILVVLVISIIGLLLVVPYGLFVLLAYFFVTTGVAAFLAQKVLTGFGGRENLMLAVTIGVVGTTVISRIPVAGPVLVTIYDGLRRRRRRPRRGRMASPQARGGRGPGGSERQRRGLAGAGPDLRCAVPASGPDRAAAYHAPSGAAAAPVAVINPIVQTSPAPSAAPPVTPAPDVAAAPVTPPAASWRPSRRRRPRPRSRRPSPLRCPPPRRSPSPAVRLRAKRPAGRTTRDRRRRDPAGLTRRGSVRRLRVG